MIRQNTFLFSVPKKFLETSNQMENGSIKQTIWLLNFNNLITKVPYRLLRVHGILQDFTNGLPERNSVFCLEPIFPQL